MRILITMLLMSLNSELMAQSLQTSLQIKDLLAPLLLLLLIIIISSAFRKNVAINEEKTKDLRQFAIDLFEFSDFPTAILDLNIRLVGANRKFLALFKPESIEKFDPFTDKLMSRIKPLISLLNTIKARQEPPVGPVFIAVEVEQNQNSSSLSSYFLMRKLICSETGQQLIAMIVIESDYTNTFANDLVQKIAQRDSDLKKLEEVDQLKSEFLATLSHELKTPLVSIKGYLDLMASGKMGPLTEKQEKALRVSLKNTSHLNSLISSILNFARMEAGKLMFDLVHQKLQPHINDIIDSLKPIADNRQITMVTDFGEALPLVIIDTELIHRVLINLLENAIKFSPPGSQIQISAHRSSENQVKVTISDQGRGIPADKLDKIKTPFFQADKSDTRPTGGLGLGLAIAEKILVGHGTTLQIESQENVGTVCSFCLKVAPAKV